jgi:hypothetical protein
MGPLCHAWLFFLSSLLLHEAVAPSSAGDQLLILFPAGGLGPPPFPPPGLTHFPQDPGTFPLLRMTHILLTTHVKGAVVATPGCKPVVLGSNPAISLAYSRQSVLRLAAIQQRWAKFRPSELPIPIPIFRLYRPIFFMDFNTLRVASSLQNEDLEALQSLHRIKRYFFC